MNWAQQRKATYTISFLFIVLIILSTLALFLFRTTPTCHDGVQNQGEQGIDCGGPCTILCRAQYSDPTILWTRSSKVLSSGTYSVLAYGTNPNIGVGAYNAPYTMTLYDANNVILAQETGTTYIPPTTNFAVFLDGININDKVPARIVFQFGSNFIWQKITGQEANIVPISKTITNQDTAPKVFATLQNTGSTPLANIESIAILYDANGNAIAFSKTKVDSIAPNASADIVFTWPEKLSAPVVRIDIVSKVLPN
jgi:hypothetical protein